ncbi:hypothetical protein [Aquibacillus sediminis]|uniref:hypothetical protein n=1 Tax=Aquibacillus sediminis TaxID=2574734 RepID=UPI001108BC75|nr:hypothetical protein [Aquibacillus sediminis]
MTIIIAIVITLSLLLLYKRYIPVFGVTKIDEINRYYNQDDTVIVDVRDYQTSCKNTKKGTTCVPLPYLNRHFVEIPNKPIILIATDYVEKNLATRLLRKKGMAVVGYYLTEDLDKERCYYEIRYTSQK